MQTHGLSELLLSFHNIMGMRFTQGSTQYVDTNYNYSGGAFTFECWFQAVDFEDICDVMAIDDNRHPTNDDTQAQVFVNTSGLVNFNVFANCSGTTWNLATTGPAAFTAGEWYYISVGWDAVNTLEISVLNNKGELMETVSTTGNTICASGARELSVGIRTHFVAGGDRIIRNAYFCDGSSPGGDNTVRARALSRIPIMNGIPHTTGTVRFFPMVDSSDTRELVGTTATTLANTPTSGDDPPALSFRY